MKTYLTGVALGAGLALAAPALGAPGQCSMTGYESFACEISADGGGITFTLPDGQFFAFVHTGDGEGPGYLTPADPTPGHSPRLLGSFAPAMAAPGCWRDAERDITFCAAIEQ